MCVRLLSHVCDGTVALALRWRCGGGGLFHPHHRVPTTCAHLHPPPRHAHACSRPCHVSHQVLRGHPRDCARGRRCWRRRRERWRRQKTHRVQCAATDVRRRTPGLLSTSFQDSRCTQEASDTPWRAAPVAVHHQFDVLRLGSLRAAVVQHRTLAASVGWCGFLLVVCVTWCRCRVRWTVRYVMPLGNYQVVTSVLHR